MPNALSAGAPRIPRRCAISGARNPPLRIPPRLVRIFARPGREGAGGARSKFRVCRRTVKAGSGGGQVLVSVAATLVGVRVRAADERAHVTDLMGARLVYYSVLAEARAGEGLGRLRNK